MDDSRQNTVLFADVSGSTQLYQAAGDATAHGAITGCLGVMRQAVEAARGRCRRSARASSGCASGCRPGR